MNERAAETHSAVVEAAQQPEVTCDQCGVLFRPKTRHVARFCKNACRQAFHTREYRIKAIRDRALPMYEALRQIADGFAQGGEAAHLAQAAIKDLKAP